MAMMNFRVLVFACFSLCVSLAQATPEKADPHYHQLGFFDLHVCNWPDKPFFFLAVFTTEYHEQIQSVSLQRPDGSELGEIPVSAGAFFKTANGKRKTRHINYFDVQNRDVDGWYTAIVTLKNGEQFELRDYLLISSLSRATGMLPKDGATITDQQPTLKWQPIPGAKWYKVTIRDKWNNKTVVRSKLLSQPEFTIPDGMLKPGGWYSWRIHARDVNEHVLFGDFNLGSASDHYDFTVSD